MKIVQINSVSGVGSTGRIAEGLSKVLDDKGYENYIFYGIGQSPKKNAFKFGTEISKFVHILKTRILGKHAFYSTFQTKKMVKKLKAINPDIIHLHNLHGHYLDVRILFEYLTQSNSKIVWTLHDCWSFTGHCAYFDYVNCEKWKTGCYSCPALKQYPKSLIFDRSKTNYRDKKEIFTKLDRLYIVTPSTWLSGLVKLSFLKEYDTRVINNGINLQTFKPSMSKSFREKHDLIDKFIILGVSSVWEGRKGLNYFLELSNELFDDEIIVIVGLDKIISKKPYNYDRIITIPRTNSIEELTRIYSEANVFLNPTLEDNFPTTNLESLACGTPVITFETGGSGESIGEGCGLIIKEKNTKSIRNAINEIKHNNKNSYITICREHALNSFDMNSKFIEYVTLYNDIV